MKNLFLMVLVAVALSGCAGLNNQVSQIKALEDCKYDISSVDSVYVANVSLTEFSSIDKIDLAKMPRLGLALLRKNVPLRAKINVNITNPSNKLAAINQFEYKLLVKNRELAGGFVNQRVSVNPHGGTVTVPIQVNSNVYDVLSDEKAMDAITDFVVGNDAGKKERKGLVTIKIKPTLDLGNRKISYPGYITIDKEISSKDWL